MKRCYSVAILLNESSLNIVAIVACKRCFAIVFRHHRNFLNCWTAQQKKLFESHKIFKMNQLKCVLFCESCWLINLWSNDDAIETLIRMHSRNYVLMHLSYDFFLAFIGFFSIRFDFSSAYVIPRGLMMVWSHDRNYDCGSRCRN